MKNRKLQEKAKQAIRAGESSFRDGGKNWVIEKMAVQASKDFTFFEVHSCDYLNAESHVVFVEREG